MKFGVCTDIDNAKAAAEAGYDYIELAAASDLTPESSDGEWKSKQKQIEAMPLLPEAFNSFIRTGKIVGEETDFQRLRNYVESALRRAAKVGGQIVVFGSGGARQIPEGFPREKAEEQMRRFLNLCADTSDKTGVVVAIEPLCQTECNFINCVREGAQLAREIGRTGVQNLADTFHMEQEQEPLTAIVESADVLAHVHVADTGRAAPGLGTFDYRSLYRVLERAGYNRRISIECHWYGNLESQLASSLQHLKHAQHL